MKRKFLIVLLAIVCIFCLSFAVAACGSTKDGADKENGTHVHDWGEWEVAAEAECEKGGTEMRKCKFDESHTQTRRTDPIDHDWGEWDLTTEAQCEAQGEETRICKNNSEHIETRKTDPTDHDWDEWKLTTEAQCEAQGEETRICKNNSEHIETRKTNPIGHNLVGVRAEKYNHVRLCDSCTYERSEDHSFDTSNSCTVCSYQIVPSVGLRYTEILSGGTVVGYSVSQGDFNGTDLVIPYYHNEKPVTTIDESGFADCQTLISAYIPNSVHSIGEAAFAGCANLVEVNLSKSLKEIPERLFSNCESLADISIPEGIETIENYILDYTAVKNIYIPASLTYLSQFAFEHCEMLESVTVSELNKNYASQDGIVYNKIKTEINNVPQSIKGEITLSAMLRKIEGSAFSYCENLESIIIPASVTEIGYRAFLSCTNLQSVVIYANGKIGDSAFYNCKNLQSVEMGDGIVELGETVFAYCSNLTQINLSNKLTTIGNRAFSSCTSLTSLVIPASVKLIGRAVFQYCDNLSSITFENPKGWFYSRYDDDKSGTDIPEEELANPQSAAEALTKLFSSYNYNNYLHRK